VTSLLSQVLSRLRILQSTVGVVYMLSMFSPKSVAISGGVSRLGLGLEGFRSRLGLVGYRSRSQACCLETLNTSTMGLSKIYVIQQIFSLLYLQVRNN